jgi:MoaA/NifB/PqqE/SkfB family radical SAM enzyme
MTFIRPERLNLAIGSRCFVRCAGCYQFFGTTDPDLAVMEESAAKFARLGIRAVTLSGGDPLTIRGLPQFLDRLRSRGIADIKVDTVGTSLLQFGADDHVWTVCDRRVDDLMSRVDHVALPLDGWSNQSVLTFREGRPKLFEETISLLNAMDQYRTRLAVVINTVVHRFNWHGLLAICDELTRHRSVVHWNVFQYTPTDRVPDSANGRFAIDEPAFLKASAAVPAASGGTAGFTVDIRTVRSRLGQYLLINSDGTCWLPDELGQTIVLGRLPGSEQWVLDAWAAEVERMRSGRAVRGLQCAEASSGGRRSHDLCQLLP